MTKSHTIFFRMLAGALCLGGLLAPGRAQSRQQLQGHLRPEFSEAPVIRAVPDREILHLAVALPLRNQDELQALLKNLYDPSSSQYRHFLSPEEFTAQFGPTEQDYQSIITFAQTHGLFVKRMYSNRLLVDIQGAASDVASAFHLHLNYHQRDDGTQFYAPDAEPSLDLDTPLLHVAGLDNFARPHSHHRKHTHSSASQSSRTLSGRTISHGGTYGPDTLGDYDYIGNDFRQAYFNGSPPTLSGTGQVIAIVEFEGFYQSDINAYVVLANEKNPPFSVQSSPTIHSIDGFTMDPSDLDGIGEASLDVEMAMSMAPGATLEVYEASGSGEQPADDLMAAILAARPVSNQITSSWSGWGDAFTTNVFLEYATLGEAYFNASGDDGAMVPGNTDAAIGVPDCMTQYMTEVGGTDLSTNPNPTAEGTPPISYASETTWNDFETGSSGGGYCSEVGASSSCFVGEAQAPLPLPTYQEGVPMASSNTAGGNGGNASYRNIPDVSMVAQQFVVYTHASRSHASVQIYDGTSGATPLWAAFMALVNQEAALQGKAPLGFANYALYSLGKGPSYTTVFHDINDNSTTGWATDCNGNPNSSQNSYSFPAVTGYDLNTGWGSPNGMNMINALVETIPTPTDTPTFTDSPTITDTPSITPTFTNSPTYTNSPTITQTFTNSPTFTITPTNTPCPTVTPTPIYAASHLGRNILAPVPAIDGHPMCLYFQEQPSSSTWTIYNILGEKVSTLAFQSQYSQCWDTSKVAPGIYIVRITSSYINGGQDTFIQKVAVIR